MVTFIQLCAYVFLCARLPFLASIIPSSSGTEMLLNHVTWKKRWLAALCSKVFRPEPFFEGKERLPGGWSISSSMLHTHACHYYYALLLFRVGAVCHVSETLCGIHVSMFPAAAADRRRLFRKHHHACIRGNISGLPNLPIFLNETESFDFLSFIYVTLL